MYSLFRNEKERLENYLSMPERELERQKLKLRVTPYGITVLDSTGLTIIKLDYETSVNFELLDKKYGKNAYRIRQLIHIASRHRI